MNTFFKKNKIGVVLTILILLVGSSSYFYFEPLNKIQTEMNNKENSMLKIDPLLFESMKIKVAYTPEGSIKLFVNVNPDDLLKLKVIEGVAISDKETIVIGYYEANMMKEENLFTKPGDKIENLFGMNITIGGVLDKTGTIVDEMHFISEDNYKKVNGDENKVYIKFTEDNVSKVFYNYDILKDFKLKFKLIEGDIENYRNYEINGKTYYPIIVGFNEANMMREENLFKNPGDKIENFFGKDVIIVGIIEETKTSLDMMHLIPLNKEELN